MVVPGLGTNRAGYRTAIPRRPRPRPVLDPGDPRPIPTPGDQRPGPARPRPAVLRAATVATALNSSSSP